MDNTAYWRGRFAILEDAAHKQSDMYLQSLEQQYRETAISVQKEIEAWYGKFAQNNQMTISDAKKLLHKGQLAEFKWTVKQYIQAAEKGNLSPDWIQKLENASARYHISRLEAIQMQIQQQMELLYGNRVDELDHLFRDMIANGYTYGVFELQKGLGVGWDFVSLNQKKLDTLLTKPWTTDKRTFRDRCWYNKDILVEAVHKELIQGMLRGNPLTKIVTAIQKQLGADRYKTQRLVHTETTYFNAVARNQMYQDFDVKQIEIVETLDGRTCSLCQPLDGTVIALSQYEAGVTVPPYHPNCRGTTCPHYDDMAGERAARTAKGNVYDVPADMQYADWKKAFLNGGDKQGLKPITKSNTIRNNTSFSPASTIKEAEVFAREVLGIPNVSYKGVDVITANAWNEGLKDAFERFPELKSHFGFVGEVHERNAMLKPMIKQYYLDKLIKRNPSFTRAELGTYADKKVRELMKVLQVGKDTYAQSWAPSTDPFFAFRGVSVNKEWGRKSTRFLEALQDDVTSQFHPIGCNTIQSVLDHEIGHQLDELLGIREIDEVQALFHNKTHDALTEALSRYAWDNENQNIYREMIAEAWAEYCNNPQPREIAKTIGEIIETEYHKKFGVK